MMFSSLKSTYLEKSCFLVLDIFVGDARHSGTSNGERQSELRCFVQKLWAKHCDFGRFLEVLIEKWLVFGRASTRRLWIRIDLDERNRMV